jgi:serine/threonine protein kinase
MERKKDSLIGKIFFRIYKVKKMLGEGSFGKIYIAYDINTKEEYAVKLVCKITISN